MWPYRIIPVQTMMKVTGVWRWIHDGSPVLDADGEVHDQVSTHASNALAASNLPFNANLTDIRDPFMEPSRGNTYVLGGNASSPLQATSLRRSGNGLRNGGLVVEATLDGTLQPVMYFDSGQDFGLGSLSSIDGWTFDDGEYLQLGGQSARGVYITEEEDVEIPNTADGSTGTPSDSTGPFRVEFHNIWLDGRMPQMGVLQMTGLDGTGPLTQWESGAMSIRETDADDVDSGNLMVVLDRNIGLISAGPGTGTSMYLHVDYDSYASLSSILEADADTTGNVIAGDSIEIDIYPIDDDGTRGTQVTVTDVAVGAVTTEDRSAAITLTNETEYEIDLIFKTADSDAVGRFTITEAGSGYTTAPTVTLTAAPSGGTNATATASINDDGEVDAITITEHGAGYTTAPTVTITAPGTGTTATATAVMGTQIGRTLTLAPTFTVNNDDNNHTFWNFDGTVQHMGPAFTVYWDVVATNGGSAATNDMTAQFRAMLFG